MSTKRRQNTHTPPKPDPEVVEATQYADEPAKAPSPAAPEPTAAPGPAATPAVEQETEAPAPIRSAADALAAHPIGRIPVTEVFPVVE
ncbi:MAG: hypothetical protein Q4G64_05170, partial [bacterium]|nr:hypothetical protein [bacterium]